MTTRQGNTKAYEVITARIIDALERGTVPWRRPWNVPEHGELRNAISGQRYRGINPIILAVSAATQGFTDPRWLTFKQAKERGACVRKGEKGTPVAFWNWIERTDDDGETTRIPFLRYYTVFNAAQIDDLELEPLPQDDAGPSFDPIEEAEKIIAAMPHPPSIDHSGGARAFYVPSKDAVHLPAVETFTSQAGYYATKFHEVGHSTGHPSRLDRKGIDEVAAFGTATYSKEELVAEFASAFLCGEVGIGDMQLEQSSAYVASWLRALRSDPKMAVTAAAQAQKAADYILGENGAAPAHVVVTPDLYTSFRKHFGADAMRRIPGNDAFTPDSGSPSANGAYCVLPVRRAPGRIAYKPAPVVGLRLLPDVFAPLYMVPGKDHRKKPGKATFRGKGLGMKCTSIRYYGIGPIPFTPPDAVMDALNGITRAGQAIGRVLYGGDYPSKQLVRPAVLITAPHIVTNRLNGAIDYMGDACPGERCRQCRSDAA